MYVNGFKTYIAEDIEKLIDNLLIKNNKDEAHIGTIRVKDIIYLDNVVPFPNMILETTSIPFTDDLELNEQLLTIKEGHIVFLTNSENSDDLGVIAKVNKIEHDQANNIKMSLLTLCRSKAVKENNDNKNGNVYAVPFLEKKVKESVSVSAQLLLIDEIIEQYPNLSPAYTEIVSHLLAIHNKDLSSYVDFVAIHIDLTYEMKQAILNEININSRTNVLITALNQFKDIIVARDKISNNVKTSLFVEQKNHYLQEQMRQIRRELNESTDDLPAEYIEAIEKLSVEEDIKNDLLDEANRLYTIPEMSPEYSIITSYLDKVLTIPFGIYSEENDDIEKAKKILEKDHYGLQKVKEQILESLAVKKLSQNNAGQIICLVGPPGVGKTSIAKSIARATNRTFQRLSLGGVHDESNIRGHRRTYLAALPGQIIDALIHAKTMNPVILLDEVDKLSNDFRGDPTSALLEVLDPEQNRTFKDNYINFPVDLSKVLFITTANLKENIPDPLYDRMDIIELSSYTYNEKFEIAKRYLLKKQLKNAGLNAKDIHITDSALKAIITFYTREAGVRNIEKEIRAICRKCASIIVENKNNRITITDKNIEEFLGPKKFKPDYVNLEDKIGIINGLAYTSVGGEVMQIEVSALKGNGKIELTGSLGDVMKESAHIAISYVRSISDQIGIDPDFYKSKDIHYHFPEGAVPKDGPSAGIGIALGLISELTGRKVKGNYAMTGEITLRGNVLPIGGLKEKSMAAYKAGIKKVLIPDANMSDISEFDKEVKDHIEFIPVNNMTQVMNYALL